MTQHEYKQTAYYLTYLIRCVLNNKSPAQEELKMIDLSQLYEVAQDHSLTAMIAFALESSGIQDDRFSQAKAKSVRRAIYFKLERTAVLSELEKAGIWYMPLKGIIISGLYPKVSMREMADNDILFDSSRVDDIKQIMKKRGFYMEHDDSGHDLAFMKKPVYNFEMHTDLFGVGHDERFNQYYENVKDRLIKDSTNNFGFHFSVEDFYIFMIAHEYKHFYYAGTGLRSLIDTYIYLNHYHTELDWNYINNEIKALGIEKYEKQSRELSMKLFSGEDLNDDAKMLLDNFIFAGTFGNDNIRIKNGIKKNSNSKVRYIMSRLFISQPTIEKSYPLFFKYKFLQPLLLCMLK
jgi:hypothetical protein